MAAVRTGKGWSGAQGAVVDSQAPLHAALRASGWSRKRGQVGGNVCCSAREGFRLACRAGDGGAVGRAGSACADGAGLKGEAVGAEVRVVIGIGIGIVISIVIGDRVDTFVVLAVR